MMKAAPTAATAASAAAESTQLTSCDISINFDFFCFCLSLSLLLADGCGSIHAGTLFFAQLVGAPPPPSPSLLSH